MFVHQDAGANAPPHTDYFLLPDTVEAINAPAEKAGGMTKLDSNEANFLLGRM